MLAAIFLFLFGYIALCVGLPLISIEEKETLEKKNIEVYLIKSGPHMDFLVPVHHTLHNWELEFPYQNNKIVDTTFEWIAIGWGDKDFYLNTPTWGDLTVSTATNAAIGLGSGGIHATYYYDIPEEKPIIRLKMTPLQYQQFCKYVRGNLQMKNHKTIPLHSKVEGVTGDYDRYYDAKGSFSIMHTCNTWVNNGLKASGQRACYWTGLAEGIFYQYGK